MSNIDAMFESDFWRACDLDDGHTFTGKIKRVEAGELQIAGTSKKKRKPVIHFENSDKALALNKTNSETIKAALGKNTSAWVGATITLYQINDAKLGKKTVDAVRVRNVKGAGGKRSQNANRGSVATEKDLEYVTAGLEECGTTHAIDNFLAGQRNKQWTKAQGETITAAKEKRIAELSQTTNTETETETESETE